MSTPKIGKSVVQSFKKDGFLIIPNVLDTRTVAKLRIELGTAIEEDLAARPEVFDSGMVHNCMFRGEEMAMLLNHPVLNAYAKSLLAEHCIVYAYQSSSLYPRSGNYGSRVHVDCPRFIPGYMTNAGVIFPMDHFTEQNGATFYLPGSHLADELPSDEDFFANARQIIANKGDMIVFNSRLVHAAGKNLTNHVRHSLTINLCRPFMRQRFDFARMIPDYILDLLNEDGRRMIGMNVRMPTSLEEFYLPPEQRLYKPGQE